MHAPRVLRTAAAAVLVAALAALAGCAKGTATPLPEPSAQTSSADGGSTVPGEDVARALGEVEAAHDVTVGVAVMDADGEILSYRGDERFGYASTLKAFAAAALLAVKTPAERAETVTWTQADVDAAGYSPVTSMRVGDGLTRDELAEAAVRDSDNTAMNLVMSSVGGPAGVEDFLRGIGDETTRVTAFEPQLNDVRPGSEENTTTPDAAASALGEILAGEALAAEEAATWLEWMSGNATGDTLIRSAAPSGWTVADKSGGAGGIRNDVAVVTSPDGRRVFLAVLTRTNDPDASYDDAAVADAARVVFDAL
ncbi:class A beta-lactamase [Microbacterium sp. LMI1-1-1.1]|uniref:class A beta-lactamase n=1 Tax=Microbacterium sp. LMI1-1-1.1 TaxID=3135223 RepID=UPI00346759B8